MYCSFFSIYHYYYHYYYYYYYYYYFIHLLRKQSWSQWYCAENQDVSLINDQWAFIPHPQPTKTKKNSFKVLNRLGVPYSHLIL